MQSTAIMKQNFLLVSLITLVLAILTITQVESQVGPPGPPGPQGPPGRDGRDGKDGEKGDPGMTASCTSPQLEDSQTASGGTVFTRWGNTTCPKTPGTKKVYSGIVAASHHLHRGGGANYLCLPNDPQPLETRSGVEFNRATIYGVDYDFPRAPDTLERVRTNNPPCVVCYTSRRSTVLVIPGKPTCQDSSWTLEYAGYLVAERQNNHRVMFECMDKNPKPLTGSYGWISGWGGLMFLTEVANCNSGIPCPPYSQGMELSCAVCTI